MRISDSSSDVCSSDLPDNIKFSEKLRTLFIGEDSGLHVNNFLWAFNVDTRQLSRIMSTPSGAESTGLQAADDINGFTYIMSNFQHAADWELKNAADGKVTGGQIGHASCRGSVCQYV